MSTEHPKKPVAIALRRITLHGGVHQDDFEKLMLDEVFPSSNTSDGGEQADQHFLLKGSPDDDYVWMSRLEYSIHQTPFPVWLLERIDMMNKDVQQRLQAFGDITSSEVRYDAASWP